MTMFKTNSLRILRLVAPLAAVAALGGCYYQPLPPPPPQAAYAAPAPAPGYYPGYYYGPSYPGYYGYPVIGSVNLGFGGGYWGGRGRWR
jgi:hypothetical protein